MDTEDVRQDGEDSLEVGGVVSPEVPPKCSLS